MSQNFNFKPHLSKDGTVLNLFGMNIETLPESIGELTKLQEIYLYNNKLTSLPESFFKLTNLREIYMHNNKLTSLPESIGKLKKLQRLNIYNNRLKSLPRSLGKLTNLQYLYCSNNRLKSLPRSLGKLTNLKELDCCDNKLTSLPESFFKLTNLREFYCVSNNLTFFPDSIINLRNLQNFYYYNNEFLPHPPHIQRFLERFEGSFTCKTTYDDSQNVHNSNIMKSTQESIFRLSKRFGTTALKGDELRNSILESSLNPKVISTLFSYFDVKDVHSNLLLTFEEVFGFVWCFINRSKPEDKKELLAILSQELADSECKCFTGRIGRVVSSLSGFSEDVIIAISEREQCSNIITLLMRKGFVDEALKERFLKECKERGISNNIVAEFESEL